LNGVLSDFKSIEISGDPVIADQGKQFRCESFKNWCGRRGIQPRFGAVGKKGSISVFERFIESLKIECIDEILMPNRKRGVRLELVLFSDWYNRHRPQFALRGQTPGEVYDGMEPANQHSLFERRERCPAGASRASPQISVAGEHGVIIRLEFSYHSGRKHFPIVTSKRAAY
jgi:hypothetical protein